MTTSLSARDRALPSWHSLPEEAREQLLRTGVVPLDYPYDVTGDWLDLLKVVEEKVKPQRLKEKSEKLQKEWWKFERTRPNLRRALESVSDVLIGVRHQKHWALIKINSTKICFSGSLDIFSISSGAAFSVLQSRIHEIWARFFASSLEDRLRYTPSDCFETFPLPGRYDDNQELESMGQAYYDFRAALMIEYNEGLTEIYNQFHDPAERSNAIGELRRLHEAIDRSVLDAYGWTDIRPTCEFELEYEEDEAENGRRRKKPWRYRWPEPVRDEVLARLLALNAKRAEEERLALGSP